MDIIAIYIYMWCKSTALSRTPGGFKDIYQF